MTGMKAGNDLALNFYELIFIQKNDHKMTTNMKLKNLAGTILLAAQVVFFTACAGEQKKTPNSDMNDVTRTGGEESRAALGVGAGNQDEVGDYPANQANLHPDSIRTDTNDIRRPQ